MDMLLDISSRLQATKHIMEEVKSDRAAEAVRRQEISILQLSSNQD